MSNVKPMRFWKSTEIKDISQKGIRQLNIEQSIDIISIEVKNMDRALEIIKKSGGKIIMNKKAVYSVGWVAYFADFKGMRFGLLQRDKKLGVKK